MAAWQTGSYWLAAGQSDTYWVSWGDTWQGLQFIVAVPSGGGARMDIISYGMRAIPQFGANSLISYWVNVINRGSDDSNFVLMGQRVD
jgi:hypothetical protein